MKSIRWMSLAVSAGLLVGLMTFWNPKSSGQAPAEKPRGVWEYKTIPSPQQVDIDEVLNKLAQQGWELVLVAPGVSSRGGLSWVFKRAKP